MDHQPQKQLVASAEWIDWGRLHYSQAHRRQLDRVEQRKADLCADALIFVEHPHVITLGRRRESAGNVLAADGVEVLEVERGGDVTYHGPGQLVAYPIIKLEGAERDLHKLLRNLETAIIETLAHFSIEAGREEGKTGVWRAGKKLASIGLACRRWVTFHGIALNIDTDLSYFSRINPCGFEAAVMTSMEEVSGVSVSREEVMKVMAVEMGHSLTRQFARAF